MGMLGTLAKVAIGIAVAKGVSGMMKGRSAPTGSAPAPRQGGGGGGLGDILEQLGGGRGGQPGSGGSGGGLGDILGQLGKGGAGGGLGDLLGQLGGQARGQARQRAEEIMPEPRSSGGGGSVFDELLGNAPKTRDSGGSFGEMFNDALERGGDPHVQPTQDEEAVAALMLRAMIQAAKSDGQIDRDEQQRLMENLDNISAAERRFIENEFATPIDIDGLVAQVPQGLEQQVYAMSLAGIKLDDQREAQYLHQLAQALGIQPQVANAIHDQMQQPKIYG